MNRRRKLLSLQTLKKSFDVAKTLDIVRTWKVILNIIVQQWITKEYQLIQWLLCNPTWSKHKSTARNISNYNKFGIEWNKVSNCSMCDGND